jgi:hypothetical protein
MESTIASGGLGGIYHIVSDLGGVIAGLLALIAGLVIYAAGRHQARTAREAADATIAALREQIAQMKRSGDAADERRRDDLRLALAAEAARVIELAAHRYSVIPLEYGPGRLETVARSACDIFKIKTSPILRRSGRAVRLLDKDAVAAAAALDEAVDALNSLLAVEGALGRLPAAELLTAFETVMHAGKRLRAVTTDGGEPAPRPARRIAALLGAAEG